MANTHRETLSDTWAVFVFYTNRDLPSIQFAESKEHADIKATEIVRRPGVCYAYVASVQTRLANLTAIASMGAPDAA